MILPQLPLFPHFVVQINAALSVVKVLGMLHNLDLRLPASVTAAMLRFCLASGVAESAPYVGDTEILGGIDASAGCRAGNLLRATEALAHLAYELGSGQAVAFGSGDEACRAVRQSQCCSVAVLTLCFSLASRLQHHTNTGKHQPTNAQRCAH